MRYELRFTLSLLAAAVLFLATPFVGAKDEFVIVKIPTGQHTIHVTTNDNCLKPRAKLTNPKDTVKWVPDNGVTAFSIDFPDSPFVNGQKHFDQDHAVSDLLIDAVEEADVYKYKIAVTGGHTCDPHVIIVGTRESSRKK
jgi:hypothetical protein